MTTTQNTAGQTLTAAAFGEMYARRVALQAAMERDNKLTDDERQAKYSATRAPRVRHDDRVGFAAA